MIFFLGLTVFYSPKVKVGAISTTALTTLPVILASGQNHWQRRDMTTNLNGAKTKEGMTVVPSVKLDPQGTN